MDILTTPSTCPNCLTLDDKINKIISIEWAMFDAVNKGKEGPRAACQEDPVTFELMRRAQFEAWSAPEMHRKLWNKPFSRQGPREYPIPWGSDIYL